MTPADGGAAGEARWDIARIIIGPRNPVPNNCPHTLRELQNIRWASCSEQERGEALWIADRIVELVQQ